MKNSVVHNLLKLKAVFLFAILLAFQSSSPAQIACGDVHAHLIKPTHSSLASRRQMVQQIEFFDLGNLLSELQESGKLIYKGSHQYVPGTEFLASNEADWLRTPFDNQPTDLMIAFGTNSSWELAVNKKTKNLIIADWSPYPLLAQGYVISPLLRLAKSPADFILLLSGIWPHESHKSKSLDDIFKLAESHSRTVGQAKLVRTFEFLNKLAEQPNITDTELKFLTSFLYAQAGLNHNPHGFGPFNKLRSASFADFVSFYNYRYGSLSLRQNNPAANPSVAKMHGALLSQENFDVLKGLYDGNHVQLALTSITDNSFYQVVAGSYSNQRITLSITNVFDCGCYNGLTFKDMQRYFASTFETLKRNAMNPLVIFRTTNNQPPHGFHRYELKSTNDIPARDESGSTALKDAS